MTPSLPNPAPHLTPRHTALAQLLASLPPHRQTALLARIDNWSDLSPLTSLPIAFPAPLPNSQPSQPLPPTPNLSPAPGPSSQRAEAFVLARYASFQHAAAAPLPPFWLNICLLLPPPPSQTYHLADPVLAPANIAHFLTRLGLLLHGVTFLTPATLTPAAANHTAEPAHLNTLTLTLSHRRAAHAALLHASSVRLSPASRDWFASVLPTTPSFDYNIISLATTSLALLWSLLPQHQATALSLLSLHTLPALLSLPMPGPLLADQNALTLTRPVALRAATIALAHTEQPW